MHNLTECATKMPNQDECATKMPNQDECATKMHNLTEMYYKLDFNSPHVVVSLFDGSTGATPPSAPSKPTSMIVWMSSSVRTSLNITTSSIIPTNCEPPPHLPISTALALPTGSPVRVLEFARSPLTYMIS